MHRGDPLFYASPVVVLFIVQLDNVAKPLLLGKPRWELYTCVREHEGGQKKKKDCEKMRIFALTKNEWKDEVLTFTRVFLSEINYGWGRKSDDKTESTVKSRS